MGDQGRQSKKYMVKNPVIQGIVEEGACVQVEKETKRRNMRAAFQYLKIIT